MSNESAVDRLLFLMPWQLRHISHQVMSLTESQKSISTVRSMLESEYKAAKVNGAILPPRRGGYDDRALNATANGKPLKRTGKCNHCGIEGHWERECHRKNREGGNKKPMERGRHGKDLVLGRKKKNKASMRERRTVTFSLQQRWTKSLTPKI